jgi:hypothetical protein
MRTVARRLSFEEIRVAVEARRFGEQATHIIAGAVS